MKTAIPFAVGVRKTEPSSETAAITSTPPASSMPGMTTRSGVQFPFACVISTDPGVHEQDVRRADGGRAEVARDEHGRPADRADDERLQQAALRVPAHDAEREEDREHDAEEQRPEHREPEHGRTDERARIDARRRRADVVEMVEEIARPEPEEEEEGDREHEHDGEHAPAKRFAQSVRRR